MAVSTKLVTIESIGKIGVLAGITGPVRTPTRLSVDVIISLINSGKIVYEVNPANHSQKVRLTRMNVYKTNFPSTIRNARAVQKKVVEEIIKAETVGIPEVNAGVVPTGEGVDPITGEASVGTSIFAGNDFQSNQNSGKKKKH